VKALAAQDVRVIAGARSKNRLQNLAGTIGESCLPFQIDITDSKATANLLANLPEDWRDIHGLVVCAGQDVGGRAPFHAEDADVWAENIETNVIGMVRICRAVIDGMRERCVGHIVTLGSTAGFKTYEGGTIYAATKFAVHAFTDALAQDYRDSDIRVTEILPGMVRTEFAKTRFRGDAARAKEFYDTRSGNLDPKDVAQTIVWAMKQPANVNISQIVVHPTRNKG